MRRLFALVLIAVATVAQARVADRLVVDKSERTLYVYADGSEIARYLIALGVNPVSHKQREGESADAIVQAL